MFLEHMTSHPYFFEKILLESMLVLGFEEISDD